MKKRPLCVAFLWHMHQPDYGNVQTGEIYLPWTRFHAVKDYYDMAALVEQGEEIHLTLNIVPSLADQLVSYSSGTARETYAVLTLRDAAQLDQQEKSFLLRAFFQLPFKQMVLPYPRYKELLDLRGLPDGHGGFPQGLKRYTSQDYRDLQFLYNLSWCGKELRRDPEVAEFLKKGKNFNEEDKKRLLEIQYSFMGRILLLYRRLMESRKIEVSVSPYYHPILPLLCDIRSARESLPSLPLPLQPFAFPEDAREQIHRAQRIYQEYFGCMPRGMWPSEGSISDASLQLAKEAGLRWVASDEGVLGASLNKEGKGRASLTAEHKYCVYRWGEGDTSPCLFFRDHDLSDLIGFTYSRWTAEESSADFLNRLNAIYESLPNDGKHYVVPIILDGENAWEHYPENGTIFLNLLYRRLSEAANLRTVTFSQFLDLEPHRQSLKSIVSGSWIYGNLATWIGHPEKNRAWEELAATRRFLGSCRLKNPNPDRLELAYREIMIAEGSDWFWWYGDDHQSENALEFDTLFRSHLKNVYLLLGESAPLELDEPIKKAHAGALYQKPVHTITPRLDGKVTDYFEWLSAGFVIPSGGESMHRSERYLDKVFFGFDMEYLYLRIDLSPTKILALPADFAAQVQFISPEECLLELEYKNHNHWNCRVVYGLKNDLVPQFAGDKILELGIPLRALGVQKPAEVHFFISVREKKRELERLPSAGFLQVYVNPWELNQQEWIV